MEFSAIQNRDIDNLLVEAEIYIERARMYSDMGNTTEADIEMKRAKHAIERIKYIRQNPGAY